MSTTIPEHILISIVGDRDPVHYTAFDSISGNPDNSLILLDPGPIVETIEILINPSQEISRPDQVYLFFADDKMPNKLISDRTQWLVRYLGNMGIASIAIDLEVENPTDYARLLTSMSFHSHELLQRHPNGSFTVLTSPGTPQMQMAWSVLGNEGVIQGEFLQKIPGKRDSVNNIVTKRYNSGRLEPLSFSSIFEAEKIERATAALTRLDFATSGQLFADLYDRTLFPHRKVIFRSTMAICQIFAFLSENNFAKSKQIVTAEGANLDQFFDDSTFSQQLLQSICAVETGLTILDRVLNVYARAQRRLRVHDYPYCIVECFAAYDLMLTAAIQIDCRLANPAAGDIWDKEKRLLGVPPFNRVVGGKVTRLHCATPPHIGMCELEHNRTVYDKIDRIRIIRNNVVHKGALPSAESAQGALDVIHDAISIFFQIDPSVVDYYPLSMSTVERTEIMLEASLKSYSPR